MENDFYIGWMDRAPQQVHNKKKAAAVGLLAIAVTAAGVLATEQRKFSTASFEFGRQTTISGVYHRYPVPSVRLMSHKDLFGNSTVLTIPLVGYGKAGAEGIIQQLEQQLHTSLDGRQVSFQGTLLYSDGKTLMQIDQHEKNLLSVDSLASRQPQALEQDLGTVVLKGEIVDPKCYFGVMKPGIGKSHLDCAVRCIEGGIMPVFRTQSEEGSMHYYILVNDKGQKLNTEIKHFVGRPVSLTARATQLEDWTILYVSLENIQPIGGFSLQKSVGEIVSCGVDK